MREYSYILNNNYYYDKTEETIKIKPKEKKRLFYILGELDFNKVAKYGKEINKSFACCVGDSSSILFHNYEYEGKILKGEELLKHILINDNFYRDNTDIRNVEIENGEPTDRMRNYCLIIF